MASLFLLLFLISLVLLVVGLINPAWLRVPSRKLVFLVAGGSAVVFFIAFGVTTDATPKTSDVVSPGNQPVATTTSQAQTSSATSTEAAQKELTELMGLAKKAKVISSYEFSDKAAVVYADTLWYSQTVAQKKDFLAKIAMLKEAIVGYRHFEMRDAYTNEKVGEVTPAGSLEVYK